MSGYIVVMIIMVAAIVAVLIAITHGDNGTEADQPEDDEAT
jgi:hypothetical protein